MGDLLLAETVPDFFYLFFNYLKQRHLLTPKRTHHAGCPKSAAALMWCIADGRFGSKLHWQSAARLRVVHQFVALFDHAEVFKVDQLVFLHIAMHAGHAVAAWCQPNFFVGHAL